jgi:hypothetical protein
VEEEDEDVVVVVVVVPVEGLISGTVRRCADGIGAAALEGREGGARGVFGGPSVRLETLRGTAVVVILMSVELYSFCSLIKSNNLNTRNETLGSLKSISEALILLVFELMFTTSSTVLATF